MWISASLGQAQFVFLKLLNELTKAGLVVKKNQGVSSMYIEIANGSTIYVRSAKSKDSCRGYDTISKIILDEASFFEPDFFETIVRPYLNSQKSNFSSKILISTTPKGKLSWVFHEWLLVGKDPAYAGCHWTSYDNPRANFENLEIAKRNTSERVFRQEYLAAWEDSASLLNNVLACATIPQLQEKPIDNDKDKYILACDPGLVNDFCCIVVMNLRGMVVYIDRFRRVTAAALKKRIVELVNIWKPFKTVVESNGIGKPLCSDLKHQHGLYIEEWVTSKASKELIIESLANSFDNMAVRIPFAPVWFKEELIGLTVHATARGTLSYKSSSGHDDAIMAFAICHHYFKKYTKSGGRYSVKS